ncbi:MAG TPA: hypothetical protein PKM65_07395 [Spirochaetota bacterium]|nr:hypothetical protein [Spirochaetota bacterium]HNT09816.1 hypothetical protein [Spirochaetota bacterium]
MIDIKGIEEGVLIETREFNMCIQNLYNDIKVGGKNLSDEEVRRFTCNVIGSMVTEGLVRLVKTTYLQEDEDVYSYESERDLTPEETDLILKEPERWEEENVFSPADVYELVITGKGRARIGS